MIAATSVMSIAGKVHTHLVKDPTKNLHKKYEGFYVEEQPIKTSHSTRIWGSIVKHRLTKSWQDENAKQGVNTTNAKIQQGKGMNARLSI